MNERNYDSVDGSGPAYLEYDVAKVLAGRPVGREMTDQEAESLADWIGRVWQVAPVAIPALLGSHRGARSTPTSATPP